MMIATKQEAVVGCATSFVVPLYDNRMVTFLSLFRKKGSGRNPFGGTHVSIVIAHFPFETRAARGFVLAGARAIFLIFDQIDLLLFLVTTIALPLNQARKHT